ncbi:unnamed protein product [Vitrella brassicaformis CCMP3155]|uniref:Uncharacterized protein n=2 Tax=Vitrella brassicaformis TaxID=1169539 RepID=A0A0G4H7V6_VITBC|nr:unnamed protein product [Vitrella brassicaformis CCMP3155]|eukprot:CEM39756.1 unnamed protein product [Vitrella brassicaformis CCMP3155]
MSAFMKLTLMLVDEHHFVVIKEMRDRGQPEEVPQAVRTFLQTLNPLGMRNGRQLFPLNRAWDIVTKLVNASALRCTVTSIPDFVTKTLEAKPVAPSPSEVNNFLAGLPQPLRGDMRPFQREGILFGLRRGGRVLIGDEMGLGKTLQALVLAAFYSNEWPVLVVCPSAIRFQWRDQAKMWLHNLVDENKVCVIKTGKCKVPSEARIVIVSYTLLAMKNNERFRRTSNDRPYQVVVADESHYIKSWKAQRTKVMVPILKDAKRCILLSGTAMLSQPDELFPQIDAVLFPAHGALSYNGQYWNHSKFENRYCVMEENPFAPVMVRRLKKDVQKDLPPKIKTDVPIEGEKRLCSQITASLERERLTEMDDDELIDHFKRHDPTITNAYTATAEAKQKAVWEYIDYLYDSIDHKFLVFAHHKKLIDFLVDKFEKKFKPGGYIRVDGGTAMSSREGLVKKFQEEEKCRVALLSITACGQGLNLTAAGTVVFAELYWIPGIMQQAEDRAHRIGSNHQSINVHYLIAEGTIDRLMRGVLERKWRTSTSVLDGQSQPFNLYNTATPTFKPNPLKRLLSEGPQTAADCHTAQPSSSAEGAKRHRYDD